MVVFYKIVDNFLFIILCSGALAIPCPFLRVLSCPNQLLPMSSRRRRLLNEQGRDVFDMSWRTPNTKPGSSFPSSK
jgi:hypothetical protein